MKRLVRKLFANLGVEIHRLQKPRDPFIDQRRLKPNASMIFDVGANVGDISLIYRQLYPDATIYAFEPLSSTAEILKRRTKDQHIRVVETALSDNNGEATFHSNRSSGTNSLFTTTEQGRSFYTGDIYEEVRTITVPLATVDEFCAVQKVNRIDILKMDIQGAELLALKGAERMLARISCVYTEVEFETVYEGQALFGDIHQFLTTRRFNLYSIYGFYFAPSGQLIHADALYVK